MRHGHPHIVLFQPEIPQNTGNIGRLAAATGSRLHLIAPLGFATDDRNLLRPGLDYWPFLDMECHDSLDRVIGERPPNSFAFFSKHGRVPYTVMNPECDTLIFGRETSGLPDELHEKFPERFFTIPMFHDGVRSLNLSNAVAIVVYHYLATRQSVFRQARGTGNVSEGARKGLDPQLYGGKLN